jgi:hypothetical protein
MLSRRSVVGALGLALALTAPASAATIQPGAAGAIVYDGGSGRDVVTVSLAPSGVTFTAQLLHAGGLLAAAPCSAPDAKTVTCPLPSALVIAGGDGGDEISLSAAGGALIPVSIDGGSGNDVLLGGAEPDAVHGGAGDDVLALAGGADDLRGDDGGDTVRTTGFTAGQAVGVSLDDAANDGLRGDGANVHSDIEDMTGGTADETVIGTPAHNVISTAAGSDFVDGGGGFDDVSAGAGADHVEARDGISERVDCGDGFDSVASDTLDFLTECEQLDVSSALEPDSDHDGYPRQVDCDDHNATIAPGRPDAPGDGIDEDCDGHDAAIVDADGDGVAVPFDCDDRDPAVHPLAREVYGNARDEDCNGRGDPYQALAPTLKVGFRSDRRDRAATRVTAFRVGGVPAGTSARLRCSGGGCPFHVKSISTAASGVDLRPGLRRAVLRPGARLQLELRRDDALTATFRYTLRRGLARTEHLCTRPDNGRAVACDAG